jgi:4-diphosphocytidyl-2-C-methyl-D-erythritol kinase
MSTFSSIANSSGGTSNEFVNQLEEIVCKNYPPVANCLAWLKQFGDARMSGSGASVFLAVPDKQTAINICEQKPENIQGFVAKGLNQHPLNKIG